MDKMTWGDHAPYVEIADTSEDLVNRGWVSTNEVAVVGLRKQVRRKT